AGGLQVYRSWRCLRPKGSPPAPPRSFRVGAGSSAIVDSRARMSHGTLCELLAEATSQGGDLRDHLRRASSPGTSPRLPEDNDSVTLRTWQSVARGDSAV